MWLRSEVPESAMGCRLSPPAATGQRPPGLRTSKSHLRCTRCQAGTISALGLAYWENGKVPTVGTGYAGARDDEPQPQPQESSSRVLSLE